MQLGPTIRSKKGFAVSRRCRRQRAFVSAAWMPSPGPALMTTATRVPRWPSSWIKPGAVAAGVMMTARSAGSARSDRLRSSGYPSISPPLAFTKCKPPLKPPAKRLRVTAAPTLPARVLAPMATTERGAMRCSRLRVDTASKERRTVHQYKARNDDNGCGDAPPAEWLAQQQCADQRAEQDRGLAQRRHMRHRPCRKAVDRNAVADTGD